MAINQNHLFEELDGVKCGIVEKLVPPARVDFLRSLLQHNGFTVVAVPSPPPKAAAPPPPLKPPAPAADGVAPDVVPAPVETPAPEPPPVIIPETYTVGVTDITFNSINAIFGRLLHTPDGHVVTLAYWHQKEKVSHDDIPYFDDPGDGSAAVV